MIIIFVIRLIIIITKIEIKIIIIIRMTINIIDFNHFQFLIKLDFQLLL